MPVDEQHPCFDEKTKCVGGTAAAEQYNADLDGQICRAAGGVYTAGGGSGDCGLVYQASKASDVFGPLPIDNEIEFTRDTEYGACVVESTCLRPSTKGAAPTSYQIFPPLPAGLNFDDAKGWITGNAPKLQFCRAC